MYSQSSDLPLHRYVYSGTYRNVRYRRSSTIRPFSWRLGALDNV